MNNDWSDFCEGDSGIVFQPHNEHVIRLTNDQNKNFLKRIGTNQFVGEVYEIASDKNNFIDVRVAAYALVWQITMDRLNCNDPTLKADADE